MKQNILVELLTFWKSWHFRSVPICEVCYIWEIVKFCFFRMVVLINVKVAKLMVIDNLIFCVLKAEINCVLGIVWDC